MEDLNDESDQVESRMDLASFILQLGKDLKSRPEDWENVTLTSYLDALAAWTADMEGYFTSKGEAVPELPTWQLFAMMLKAAARYE
ncbi:DUF7660 family protein [Streptosporangium sp. CA-115845]|uniref:DUF7660 family protein n=1 Tax=Streptosporangium sp. CA-115845 TaxID=3240071 RepID=UPI003D9122CE